jgi:hypothetical protein
MAALPAATPLPGTSGPAQLTRPAAATPCLTRGVKAAPGQDKAGGQRLVIHPPSGPFVCQGLAAAQQRPLSPVPAIEAPLPKADLLPQPPSGQAGRCVNKGAPARCTGRRERESVTWRAGGTPTWLVPCSCPGDLGPSCRVVEGGPPAQRPLAAPLCACWGEGGGGVQSSSCRSSRVSSPVRHGPSPVRRGPGA